MTAAVFAVADQLHIRATPSLANALRVRLHMCGYCIIGGHGITDAVLLKKCFEKGQAHT